MIEVSHVRRVQVEDYHYLAHVCLLERMAGLSHVVFLKALQLIQLESLATSLMSTLKAKKELEQPGGSATDTRFSENVSELVGQDGAEASEWETIDQTHLSKTFGQTSLEIAETGYVGSAHWIAILDGVCCCPQYRSECIQLQPDEADRLWIAELKDHYEDEDNPLDNQGLETGPSELEGPELLFGCNASKHTVLVYIPGRPVVDRLVSRVFNVVDIAPGGSFVRSCCVVLGELTRALFVIHSPTFLKEVNLPPIRSVFDNGTGIFHQSDSD